MNYITLAEKSGLDRDLAILIYRKINGGYYISLSYAKPPILYVLDNWPRKYLNSKLLLWSDVKNYGEIDKILTLFISLDVYLLHFMASIFSGKVVNITTAEKDIQDVFKKIEEKASSQGFTTYPARSEIEINPSDIQDLAKEIVEKRRKEEINADIYDVIDEIAYESEFVKSLKSRISWLKSISRGNVLKAIGLQGKLDEFFEFEKLRLSYLVASTTLYFDNKVINEGISATIDSIKAGGLSQELEKVKEDIKKRSVYF